MKEKAFNNWRHNAIHLTFPNGNCLSTTWACCSYSENHDMEDIDYDKQWETFRPSDTAEVMILNAPEKLIKRIYKKLDGYYGDPLGYVTMEQWLWIVKMLSK